MVIAASPNSIVHRPLEVKDRLAELGLNQDCLWDALRAGLYYKAKSHGA